MGPFYRIILMSDSCIDFLCPRFICVKLFTERVPGQQSYSLMSSPGSHMGGSVVVTQEVEVSYREPWYRNQSRHRV